MSTYDQIFATDEDLDILRHNKNAAPYLLTGYKVCATLGRGGGQVVSVLAFYSNDPSSNPADAYSFSVEFVFEKNENKQKRGRVGPFKSMCCTSYR